MAEAEKNPSGDGEALFPEDVVFEILLRLPAKSICRFHCVSPRWRAIIADPLFVSSHFARSSAHPLKLLFLNRSALGSSGFDLWGEGSSTVDDAQAGEDKTFLLMESAADSSDELNLSSYGRIPGSGYCASQSAGGLICFDDEYGIRVGNPSTGDYIIISSPVDSHKGTTSVLGYDPVEHKYVILSSFDREIWFLTLGQKAWRQLDCRDLQFEEATCIDGVLHIRCYPYNNKPNRPCLLLFDVRLETFRMVSFHMNFWVDMLMAFGEFGRAVNMIRDCHVADTDYGDPDFDVSVLEDPENQLWSRKRIFIPSHLTATIKNSGLSELRFTRVGDVLLVPNCTYIYLFTLEDASLRKMEISKLDQNFPEKRWHRSLAITQHVDSLQSVQGFY